MNLSSVPFYSLKPNTLDLNPKFAISNAGIILLVCSKFHVSAISRETADEEGNYSHVVVGIERRQKIYRRGLDPLYYCHP